MSGLALPVAPNARIDLLKSIADPSMKPKLKKVDPNQIKDRIFIKTDDAKHTDWKRTQFKSVFEFDRKNKYYNI